MYFDVYNISSSLIASQAPSLVSKMTFELNVISVPTDIFQLPTDNRIKLRHVSHNP